MKRDASMGEEQPPQRVARPWHARPWVRIGAMCLVLLCVALGSSGAIDRRAVVAALKDPLSIFAGRSPGARAPGAMTQTKPDRSRIVLGRTAPPRERVLSGTRSRPAAPVAAPAGTPGTAIVDGPVETAGAGPGPIFTDGTGPGGGVITDGGAYVIPPIGGPGGGGGGVILPNQPTQPTDPAPAVPEPATWLTMMLGVGAIGVALRRRRARASAASHA